MTLNEHKSYEYCVLFNIDHFAEQSGIRVSTDTCWQKKGSGKAYNSLSG